MQISTALEPARFGRKFERIWSSCLLLVKN
jgi:hypothetical protein